MKRLAALMKPLTSPYGRFAPNGLKILAIASITLCASGAARADNEPVAVEVRVGLGASSAYTGWVPVEVSLDGRVNEDLESRVVAESGARWGGGEPFRVERSVPLPRGVRKHVFLYAWVPSTYDSITVHVERPDGVRLSKPAGTSISWRERGVQSGHYGGSRSPNGFVRVGVLSRGGGAAPVAGPLAVLTQQGSGATVEYEVVALETASLPDRRIGYDTLDVVVLHDVDLAAITPECRDALHDWALAGGRLIVSIGLDPGWLSDPFFRDLLPPGRLRAEQRTSFDGTGAVPRFLCVSLEGAKAVATLDDDDARPLASRYGAGLGEVTLVGLDIASGPLKGDEDVRSRFWQHLAQLSMRPADPQSLLWRPTHADRSQALRMGVEFETETPVLTIALIALAYVLTIGPINFFLLRRRGKEPLVVWTIPAIALVFTAGTFALGGAWRGTRLRVREVDIVRARSGERFALEQRLIGIFPGLSTTLDVGFEKGEEGVPAPAVDGSRGYYDSDSRGFRLEQAERSRLLEYQLSPGESACFGSEVVRDMSGGVTLSRTPKGWEARNDTARAIRGLKVYENGNAVGEADVPARASAPLTGVPSSWSADVARPLVEVALDGARSTFAHRPGWVVAIGTLDPEPSADGRTPLAQERVSILVVEAPPQP